MPRITALLVTLIKAQRTAESNLVVSALIGFRQPKLCTTLLDLWAEIEAGVGSQFDTWYLDQRLCSGVYVSSLLTLSNNSPFPPGTYITALSSRSLLLLLGLLHHAFSLGLAFAYH